MRRQVPAALVVLSALAAATLGCREGLKPVPAENTCPTLPGFCGTVTFHGTVPDSTDWVRVVAYALVPRTATELFGFAGFSEPIPTASDSAFYTCCLLPLGPGTYEWVLVAWKKAGELDTMTAVDLLREIGSYRDPSDSTRLAAVTIVPGRGTSGVDIRADFSRMRSVSDFFPPAAR